MEDRHRIWYGIMGMRNGNAVGVKDSELWV